jgi:hypothetical protein
LTAKKQLESLRRLDFRSLQQITLEREDVTKRLSEGIESLGDGEQAETISDPVRKKIHELTIQTLAIDTVIKERLLDELSEKALALSDMAPQNPE